MSESPSRSAPPGDPTSRRSQIKPAPPARAGAAMPRYTAHVRGEWLAVPCGDAALTVGWLGREAIRRYIKNKPDNGGANRVELESHSGLLSC